LLFLCILGQKIVLGYFQCLVTIEYFQLNSEYLRNSFHFKKDGATRGAHAAQARALRERLRGASDIPKYSICNLQFSIPR